MSVAVSSSTVVSPLWGTAEDTSPPTTIPVYEKGTFLSFQLIGDKRNIAADDVTFVAFHPVDETCFVFGTSSGKAYGVSLQDNKVFLLANLGNSALRCGIFCPGYLTSPIVVLVKAERRLVFVDWQRGTVVQETVMTAHTQPILRLVTGPSTESLFCAVSGDALSCWEPASEGVGVSTEKEQRAPVDSPKPGTTVQASNAAAAPVKNCQNAEAPFYFCTGSAVPTHCAQEQPQGSEEVQSQRLGKTPHRFLGLHIIDPSLLISVETNNVLSLWTRGRDLSGTSMAPFSQSDSSRTADGVSGASAAPLDATVWLRESVVAPSTLRVRCSAACGAFVTLGGDAVTTSKQGPTVEPVVAFVDAHTLAGIGVVRLPSGSYSSSSSANASRNPSRAAVTVVQVSALQPDLVACLLSTGVVHVVLSSTYHLVFSIGPPSIFPGSDATLRSASVASTSSRPWWYFTPSGPTFGAMHRNQVLLLLHLPTARRESVSGGRGAVQVMASPAMRSSDTIVQRRRVSPVKNDTNDNINNNKRAKSSLIVPQPQMTESSSLMTLAQPFLRHRAMSKNLTTPASAAGTNDRAAFSSSTFPTGSTGETPEEVAAALAVIATCRTPPKVPSKGFPTKWVDVNLVDMRFFDADSLPSGDEAPEINDARGSPFSAERTPSVQILWSAARFCDTLPAVSCQYNLEQLHAHLMKHGVFPHSYRPFIWRFLVGLPSKAKTASQFAAVARRPQHVAVEQLMKPFPLPRSKTRQAVEEALSCLCWASPVLTLASYLPALVYPLVMLYRDDVQTVVELTLIFFANWGREFFLCHPRGPTSLLTTMERELGRLDVALSQHLKAVGAGVDVWGWELMTSCYTDVLTGPEWLQVMDHAFAAAPTWLFAFHITLMRRRLRASLMTVVSADEARHVLSHPAGTASSTAAPVLFSLKAVVEDAYRLHGEWINKTKNDPLSEISSYAQFQTLSPRFEYPDVLVHNAVVLAEKMRELALVQRSRDEAAEAAKRYAALRKEADADAAKEAAFLQQQRARVEAKYDASATAWQVQVALERSRQEQEAQERELRWQALQRCARNAEKLQALNTEMNTIESQLRHDIVDRHMEQLKWGLATHMTDEELSRLQRAAEEQVERVMRNMEEDAETHAKEIARFHSEPALKVEVSDATDVKSKAAECVNSADMNDSRSSLPHSGTEGSIHATQKEKEETTESSENAQHVDPQCEENRREKAHTRAHANSKEVAQQKKANEARNENVLRRHRQPCESSQTTTSEAATSSSSFSSHHEVAQHEEAPHAADESTSSSETETEPAGNNTTVLSASTQTYASPRKDSQPSRQLCAHQPMRRPGPPAPRHTAYRRSAGSDSCDTSRNASDPTLQSFVELRDRVFRRLQPTSDVNVFENEELHRRRHQICPNRISDSESATTTTTTDAPIFTTTSYYTSSTYTSRTGTSTTHTSTSPSTSKTASSCGHRLFQDLSRREYAPRAKGGDRHSHRSSGLHSSQRSQRLPMALNVITTSATSTSRRPSYDTSSNSGSYSGFGTSRPGELTATTVSSPATSTAHSHSPV